MPNTDYPYIQFVRVPSDTKTSVWECRTRHGDTLGRVKWFGGWRQYCFFPTAELSTVFSAGCLADVQAFIEALMAEWRMEHQHNWRTKSLVDM